MVGDARRGGGSPESAVCKMVLTLPSHERLNCQVTIRRKTA